MLRKILWACVIILLCALTGMLVFLNIGTDEPQLASEPVQTAETEPTEPEPTEAPTEAVTEAPTEAPTEPPEPVEYTLSFAGDCCLGNKKGWSPSTYFMGTVGDNYEYPFANVQEYFANDDCTFVNLEVVFTDSDAAANKTFVFKGPTSYTQILTAGNVEFANVVNNHTRDYGQQGYDDTIAALDEAGLLYAEEEEYIIFTTESGLTLGVYADQFPENMGGLEETIAAMREDGAEIVIVCLHWGVEYYYQANAGQQSLGHAAIDAGADIVYGHHPHVLQRVEEYNDGYIYYSLGNFSFGGHTNPPDKDTAILQQTVIREPDGTVHLGELTMIPCSLSSVSTTNDFQPTPLEEGTDAYERVLSKLEGTYNKVRLQVDYRPDLG